MTPRQALPALFALTCLCVACGSQSDRAYRACLDQVENSVAELRRESAQAEAIAKPLIDMARTAGVASCEAMREACKQNPDGMICKTATEELLAR